ncbi:MAG TPA: biotin/lipoyl-binding protein, partial [Vicinamibacterales bacterium]|nr:biotin/lipoyl-binding protein [Vicinamibacterales bacterium]
MSTRTKIVIAVGVVLVFAAVVAANVYYRRDRGIQVATEAIRLRDLEAIVSASGKIQPKRQVNISANTMGKVTRLAVEEGQRVKAGQFLLEIDPRSLAGQLERGEASIAAAQSSLQSGRTA